MFYTLFFAKPVFLPIVLAGLLNFLFSPVVRFLKRFHIPEPQGAGLVVLGFMGGAAFGIYRHSGPAADWVEKAPRSLQRLEYTLRDVKRPVEQAARRPRRCRSSPGWGRSHPGGRSLWSRRR